MTNPITTTSNHLFLTFNWEGQNTSRDLRIEKIKIIIKEARTQISVQRPNNKPVSFICSTPDGQKNVFSTLRLTMEQIKNITLKAALVSSEIDVPLEFSTELELGQQYQLNFEQPFLKAKMVKELNQNQRKLFEILSEFLIDLIKAGFLKTKILLLPFSNIDYNKDLNYFASKAIEEELRKIEINRVNELVEEKETLEKEWERKSGLEQKRLEKIFFKDCFETITPQGIENIMRLFLKGCIKGSLAQEILILIDERSKSFSETIMSSV